MPAHHAQKGNVVDLPLLTRKVRDSFLDWKPKENVPEMESRLAWVRGELRDCGDDLDALLRLAVSDSQLLWALSAACDELDTPFIDVEPTARVTRRISSFNESRGLTEPLEIETSVLLRSIDIPDPHNDELVVSLNIATGAPISRLRAFVLTQKLMNEAEIDDFSRRVHESDSTIGATETERSVLEKCLGVGLSDAIRIESSHVHYNFWEASDGMVYRGEKLVAIVKRSLNLTNYPFDSTRIQLRLVPRSPYDVTEMILREDPIWSFQIGREATPRGFTLTATQGRLEPHAYLEAEGYVPTPVVNCAVTLRREPSALIWRNLLPTAVVLACATFGTLFVLLSREARESVMTSVIPAVLIASVALQLTAAQHLPSRARETLVDRLFVFVYLQILCLFASLLLMAFPAIAWTLFTISVSLVFVGVALLVRSVRSDSRT